MAGGLLVAGYAQTFPPMPGQNIGPSLFPTVIGIGLALAGGVLAVSGLKRRDTPWLEIDAWARRTLRDVHALASAYAWSERDVLALSPTRRTLYRELCGL